MAGPLDSLSEIINKNNLSLKYIFITHAHWDHVEGIFDLKEKFPEAKVCISNEEYMAMQDYTNYAKTSDPEQYEEFMQDSALARMISTDLGAIKPDIFVKDNEAYELGNSSYIRVMANLPISVLKNTRTGMLLLTMVNGILNEIIIKTLR